MIRKDVGRLMSTGEKELWRESARNAGAEARKMR